MHEEITAYHEAGHVVMAFSAGMPIELVTIDPEKIADLLPLGIVIAKPESGVSIFDLKTMLVGGPAAEIMYLNMSYGDFPARLPGSRDDWTQFKNLNRHFIELVKEHYGWTFELVEADLKLKPSENWLSYAEYTFKILTYRWNAVVALAEELLKQRTLNGRDAFLIYEYASFASFYLGWIPNRRVVKIAEIILLPFFLVPLLMSVWLGPQIYRRGGTFDKIMSSFFMAMIKLSFFRRRPLK